MSKFSVKLHFSPGVPGAVDSVSRGHRLLFMAQGSLWVFLPGLRCIFLLCVCFCGKSMKECDTNSSLCWGTMLFVNKFSPFSCLHLLKNSGLSDWKSNKRTDHESLIEGFVKKLIIQNVLKIQTNSGPEYISWIRFLFSTSRPAPAALCDPDSTSSLYWRVDCRHRNTTFTGFYGFQSLVSSH